MKCLEFRGRSRGTHTAWLLTPATPSRYAKRPPTTIHNRAIQHLPANVAWRFLVHAAGLALTLGLVQSVSAAENPPPAVPPGGVVVWPGDGPAECGAGDRQWRTDKDCVYPVDLFVEPGEFRVWRRQGDNRLTRQIQVSAYPYETQVVELQDDSKVNLSETDLTRVQRENADIRKLWELETPVTTSSLLPLSPPLHPLPPGGRFGARRIFNGQPRSPHSGVDYAAARGTPVMAVAPGKVVLSDNHFFAGNSVFIDHGDGLISMFFHLDEILVQPGQTVARGQQIATVGATGRATGPHLHYGLRWHGQRIDPTPLYRGPDELPRIR